MEKSTMSSLVNVLVENAYTATEDDELSLRPGDVIRSVERSPGGWWRGELRGRVGLFPDNFVRIMGFSEDPNNDVTLRNSSPRYCRALFSYQQANPDELNLSVGDVIQVLGEEEEGWWRGQRGAHRGVFPSNFVEPLETGQAPPPVLPPKPVREFCQVLFPYTAANADELTLVEGDVVAIVSRDVLDQGWWRGELRGRIGLFPDNFVRLLPPPPSSGLSSTDSTAKKPGRPAKNLSSHKSQPSSMNRKDSTSSKSSIGSAHENIASVRKSLESADHSIADSSSPKAKKLDKTETGADGKGSKPRKSLEADSSDSKSRKSLEVDGAGKPPVPSKKAGSPVAAMLSGFKQKVLAVEHRLTGQTQSSTDVSDGITSSRPSGEPILRSISPSPLSASLPHSQPSPPPPSNHNHLTEDNFNQIERGSMLNDPRAGRVKPPRRRPPSQVMRDDIPLTNGSTHTGPPAEAPSENEIIKPKAREWEKHRAPWMEELKLNQAKKTSPIAEIGRSKTISTTESSSSEKSEVHHVRLSGSSDKILDSVAADDDKVSSLNPLEMSQSMNALSSNAMKIESFEEVQAHTENPSDSSKFLSTMTSHSSHMETNNKISPNELRTSISSSASVVLRSKTGPQEMTPLYPRLSSSSHTSSITSQQSSETLSSESTPVIRPFSNFSHGDDTSNATPKHSLPSEKIGSDPSSKLAPIETLHKIAQSNGDSLDLNSTPEQLLIAQLNERVANLERVVETQEERFSAALSALNTRLTQQTELTAYLQAELSKRFIARV